MRVLPRSTPARLIVVGVLVVVVVAAVWNRRTITDVYTYFFPGSSLDRAARDTSDPADVVDLDPLPAPPTLIAGPTGTDPAIQLERLVDMQQPSAVVDPAGAGRVLVTTLAGEVRTLDLDTGDSSVVLDLRDEISTGGEQGLLGMAIDPGGERLYLDFTDPDGDTQIRSWPLVDGRPEGGPGDGILHLRIGQPFRNHNGGHLAFGPDGLLWIGVGDGGSANDPGNVAQDPDTLLGSMLRVLPSAEGGIVAPSSNPAWGDRPETWAIGLRNPWRYSFDRATGMLWVADVGQNSVEEVTVVDPGEDRVNFGWDRLEGTRPFEGEADPSFTDPVVEYGHDDGCSITGGYVYRGDEIASLHGWYLFGDFCGAWVRAVPADDPTTEPVELVAGAGPAISFAELEDGELLFLTLDGIDRIVAAG